MSHLTSAPVRIKEIADLRAAAKHFGGELIEAKTFHSYQHGQKCEYAISLPGVKYQVGIRREKSGDFSLHFDPLGNDALADRGHDGHKLVAKFVQGLNLLTQRCAAETVLRAAKRKGVLCSVKTLSNGSLQLRMSV